MAFRAVCSYGVTCDFLLAVQLGGFAFIGEGIPIGLGAAFQVAYRRVDRFPTLASECSNGLNLLK